MFGRVGANRVTLADHATTPNSAAGKVDAPALRPVVPPTGGVDPGCASEFREVADKSVLEQASLGQVFQQGRVGLVVHRGNDVSHALDRGERLGAVDVPGDLVEHRQERVDRHAADTGFDQPTSHQAALAETVHPVAVTGFLGFLGEIKCGTSLLGGDDPEGGLETAVEQLGVFAALEVLDRGVDDLAETLPSIQPGFAD